MSHESNPMLCWTRCRFVEVEHVEMLYLLAGLSMMHINLRVSIGRWGSSGSDCRRMIWVVQSDGSCTVGSWGPMSSLISMEMHHPLKEGLVYSQRMLQYEVSVKISSRKTQRSNKNKLWISDFCHLIRSSRGAGNLVVGLLVGFLSRKTVMHWACLLGPNLGFHICFL